MQNEGQNHNIKLPNMSTPHSPKFGKCSDFWE